MYQKSIFITTASGDKYFRLRLLELFEKEVKKDSQFQFTRWGAADGADYSYTLEDYAGILGWMEKKHLVALLAM